MADRLTMTAAYGFIPMSGAPTKDSCFFQQIAENFPPIVKILHELSGFLGDISNSHIGLGKYPYRTSAVAMPGR
jgi:hypothetical protein